MISGTYIRVVAIVVSAVFVVGTWVVDGSPQIGFLRFFAIAVLAASVLVALWDRWVWKWTLVQRLPRITRDVSGTWEADLESFWVDPSAGSRVPVKTVYLVIRQTSSTASVTLLSGESRSKSSMARVVEEGGTWLLHYLYSNEPDMSVVHRSPIHHGSGVLSVVGNPAKRMNGSYWTDRETKGKLTLNRRARGLSDDYADARSLFVSADDATSGT